MDWNTANAVAFRKFVGENPAFFWKLQSVMPKIIYKEGNDKAASTGAAHGGAEEMLEAIKGMLSDKPSEEKTPYIDPNA